MSKFVRIASLALLGLTWTSLASEPQATGSGRSSSRLKQSVTGPAQTMNEGVAAGATATVTLQPVPPKTVPATSYPPGSAIMGQTLTLGSVPARVWIETHFTGWGPDVLRTAQVSIDATDVDGDGGGFRGDRADCNGLPMQGAGDLAPARQACTTNADCRPTMAGRSTICSWREVSRCLTWDGSTPGPYFPPGKWCEPVFFDYCDPSFFQLDSGGIPLPCITGVDLSTLNFRYGGTCDPGEVPPDFHPSKAATLVLDVPANAKGTYTIDIIESQSFLQNDGPPGNNNIPIAAVYPAIIEVACGSCCTNLGAGTTLCTDGLSHAECNAMPSTNVWIFRPGTACDPVGGCCLDCLQDRDCNDFDVCTINDCQYVNSNCPMCVYIPVAGWNPAAECCHPMSGAIGPIPQSSPCKVGGCSLGASSGTPTLTTKPDGTTCASIDPCVGDGVCGAGACMGTPYAGKDCPKPRFISFNAGSDSGAKAYRIKMVSLHHPNPPYTGAPTVDFSMHEGQVRWVGPPAEYPESSSDVTPVYASLTQCQPHYQNWFGIDPLHVTGGEIIPSSLYHVQSIDQGLDINNEANYSAPIAIATARWGESVIPYAPPATFVQPDASDISEIVDKFRSANEPVSKPRALLTGPGMAGVPDLNSDVTFNDVAACVDANRGKGYPYPWPANCP